MKLRSKILTLQYDSSMRNLVFVGIDWGTSSARAYGFDDQGTVLATANDSPEQAMGVQTLRQRLGRDPTADDFAASLNTLYLALLAKLPSKSTASNTSTVQDIPFLASGMIGSKQGLVDAGYVACPTSPAALASVLVQARCGRFKLHIVPGLRMAQTQGGLPDFMRGEETQVLGAQRDGLFVLPGSHSKWVDVERGVITQFETQFSGELFAVLKEHSILGRLFAANPAVPQAQGTSEEIMSRAQFEAFEQGIDIARKHPQNLLQHLFSTRALGLDGRLSAQTGESFLSGLLIGHEVCAALASRPGAHSVNLVGSSALCERYAQALGQFGIQGKVLGSTSAFGLWQLGVAAHLTA
jgi:2-dehydro-3-deoxygalactonokinase